MTKDATLHSSAKAPFDHEENGGSDEAISDTAFDQQWMDGVPVPVCPPCTTERKLLARIDMRLMPVLCVFYLLAFIDRTNMANANVVIADKAGHKSSLALDLLLTGTQYNTSLTIFFVPYVLFEVPSNVLLKKLSPRVWLSICMFSFGLVMLCQGFVQSYGGLLATRFFLGLCEAGAFPGCFYLIGMWYKREEAQKRFSFFFSSTSLAGAFGGLLATAISKMNGIRGYAAWRWIFILEGLLTCIVALSVFFIIPNFPEEAKWINTEEKAYVKARLEVDQQKSGLDRPITGRDVVRVFKDYKIFLGGFMYFGMIVPAYAYAFFAPSIIQGFGYNAIQTQLHSVPPWAASFGWSMVVAYFSDWSRHRYGYTVFSSLVAIAGFSILLSPANNSVKYGALFLCTCGNYVAMPIIVCWFNMNLGGHHRRAVGSAWQVGFGNVGGIIATYAFLVKDKPKYIPGYSICIAFLCLSMIACAAYFVGCVIENRRKDKMLRNVGLSESEKTELGDLSPDYRYML